MIGASDGFDLWKLGLLGRLAGSWPRAALIAACTSRAAASMLRLSSNCSVTWGDPSELVLVISVTPAIRPNCRSSGVATADAIVSGLAPGRVAETEMVGDSTCGRGATGRKKYASAPASATATVSSVVPTGRRMNGADRLDIIGDSAGPSVTRCMTSHPLRPHRVAARGHQAGLAVVVHDHAAAVAVPVAVAARLSVRPVDGPLRPGRLSVAEGPGDAIEVEVDHRRRVERQHLAEDQAP